MKCIKVFNNSTVSTIMPDGQEAIVLGKGIGFNQRPGSKIREQLIEKVYYVQSEMQTKFLQMLQNVRPDVIAAAEEIIAVVTEAGFSLSNQATISLIDHISFAMVRLESQMSMPNLLLRETHLLYPKEYSLGQQALNIVKKYCGVQLPEDEAGYIALHLVSISSDRNATYDALKFVKGALDIICRYTSLKLESTDMTRLMTHLKFLAHRIFQNVPWNDAPNMDDIYKMLLKHRPQSRKCLEELVQFIWDNYHYELNQQEKFYLLIHLTKII